MDKIIKFKALILSATNAFKVKNYINDLELSKMLKVINYRRLQAIKENSILKIPNLLELQELETFFQIDLKEYYPTQCPKAQEFILKRLSSKIKLGEMSKLLGVTINHYDLMTIENVEYVNYNKKQVEIYTKFMDLVIKS